MNPNTWKKSNIFPVLKKGDEQIVNNCRSVSPLPIFGKVLSIPFLNKVFGLLFQGTINYFLLFTMFMHHLNVIP